MSSDEEGTRGGRAADDDVALPKATVNKLIQGRALTLPNPSRTVTHNEENATELLPPGFTASKEVKDLMAECCKGSLISCLLCDTFDTCTDTRSCCRVRVGRLIRSE